MGCQGVGCRQVLGARWRAKGEGNSVVPRFALHSGLRQSGAGLRPGLLWPGCSRALSNMARVNACPSGGVGFPWGTAERNDHELTHDEHVLDTINSATQYNVMPPPGTTICRH